MTPVEFQAVILAAGTGSRISELTTEKPKCLLPIGSKPLVWYPLIKLQNLGFKEVILVVLDKQKSEIQSFIDKSDLTIKIDYFCVTDSHNYEDLGTAGSLKLISDKLRSDVFVISCDLITDVNFRDIIDTFRRNDASVVALFTQPDSGTVQVPGPKSKHKPEKDLVGIDVQTNRLIFFASASDFEEQVTLPVGLLKKHSNIKIYSNLLDAHVYILKNWIVKFLTKSSHKFTSIKGDLLPYIIKKQLQRPQSKESSATNEMDTNEICDYIKEDDETLAIRQASCYNDHKGDLKGVFHEDSIRCYAVVADKDNFGLRINTLPAFWQTNGNIVDKWTKLETGKELVTKHSKSNIKSNQIDNKCIIWEGAKLNEKTSFKNSIIGANTNVLSFSSVFNSIVMNNVTINEKVILENCIVCDNVTIESNCRIKNCIIGAKYTVPTDSQHTNELLMDSDRLMEF